MLSWQDVLVAQEYRKEALGRAARERMVRSILTAKEREPRFYQRLMVRLGGWMEMVGGRLKKRYTVVVEPALPSTVQTNRGCIL